MRDAVLRAAGRSSGLTQLVGHVGVSHGLVQCPTKVFSRFAKKSRFFDFANLPPTSYHTINQLRIPLAPKSANIQPNKHLTPFQRGIILGHRLSGTPKPQIAKDLNTTLGRVKYTLSTTIHNENSNDAPRSGRPKKLSDRQRCHLIRIARRDPKINYRKLSE